MAIGALTMVLVGNPWSASRRPRAAAAANRRDRAAAAAGAGGTSSAAQRSSTRPAPAATWSCWRRTQPSAWPRCGPVPSGGGVTQMPLEPAYDHDDAALARGARRRSASGAGRSPRLLTPNEAASARRRLTDEACSPPSRPNLGDLADANPSPPRGYGRQDLNRNVKGVGMATYLYRLGDGPSSIVGRPWECGCWCWLP